ncbi:hypothetical protein GobsT_53680 [Gemmata obscuriglobus]|uniref:Lipoprotein n=1 Tax=Gemmata obscuriglobus TaxID=114 RepID=A0A2Z3GR17_9BACT|nr:hypothetical protein [Gemmata obscuriglobus]AWM36779.1 hypothetical protein C1280_06925 [Gemmata obscuriglobus]QEG30563.1 hypothetical protein GobsT_53680 [Gemmata obscuriglobus]VTS09887.1 unnamed protein product [Gemmata obscuriglobus UQM 2246]
MTKSMRAAAAAAILTAGLGSVGCVGTGSHRGGEATLGDRYRNYVDPCYPERYNHAARQATIAPFAQQVHNGHVLNQTIFTYNFEQGTDKLTPAGMAKLDSIARTRPAPDPKLYIQAATDDILLTDANADKIVELRAELDAKRAAAVQKYLATVPTYVPVQYEIAVHNPATPGVNAEFATGAYRTSAQNYSGARGSGSANGAAIGTGGGGTSLTTPPAGTPR